MGSEREIRLFVIVSILLMLLLASLSAAAHADYEDRTAGLGYSMVPSEEWCRE